MRSQWMLASAVLAWSAPIGVGLVIAACSSDDGTNPNAPLPGSDASTSDVTIGNDAGQALKPFVAPSDPGGGAVLFSASGEEAALSGFKFPPDDPANDTYMVDGWSFALEKYITVFDHVTLWDNPNMVPTDQSLHGNVVAHVDGPWVVDLHKGGTLAGKGGGNEKATPVAVIRSKDDGSSFDTATTYGFGFSTVAAPPDYDAYNVNLDVTEVDDYAYMAQNGYSVLYVGTATFAGTDCTQTNASPGPSPGIDAGADVDGGTYDFTKMPQTIKFRLGFSTPTNYVNCENGTDLSGPGVNGEEHPRGVQLKSDQSITAQVTIHMDHPFWESFAEDSPLHWDPIAAQYVGVTGIPEAHTEDLKGVSFLAFTDKTGAPLPWRNCSGTNYTPPNNGQMGFDPLTVPVDPNATDPSKALRDYYDYIRYTQATQGHLNSQGLCHVDRQYPAPGGGSGK